MFSYGFTILPEWRFLRCLDKHNKPHELHCGHKTTAQILEGGTSTETLPIWL